MSTLDIWLDGQLYNAAETTATSTKVLDEVLFKVALATASLWRAGPSYARKSEALWFFAAGSWTRSIYEQKTEAAKKKLPKNAGVWNDVAFAENALLEAIALLRRWGDGRDVRDLVEAVEQLQKQLGEMSEGRESLKMR